MSDTVLKVENLHKRYRLGVANRAAFKDDLQIAWAKLRGKPDPTERYITANELAYKTQDELKREKPKYVWALQDINFEVKRGEVLGIIGKNGAGKSTLLKILSKTTAPTRGQVKVKGRVASLLEVGTGFHPELTGRENIYLNGLILGMKRHEITAKLEEIVDFAGVENYLDTPTKRYSSGMKVRLGFAVAAHLEPDILVVDEVLAVGDAEFQKKAIGKMQEVSQGGGRTVLFVSHNMGSVKALCNRCIVLKDGAIGITDITDKAINFYLSSSEATGENEINISERTDRYGSGVLKFTDAYVSNKLDEGEGLRNHIVSGETCVFTLKVANNTFSEVDKVSFIISIENKDGITLSTFHTRFDDKIFNVKKEGSSFFCQISNFPFSPGVYNANIRTIIGGDSGKSGATPGDHLNNAFTFTVHEGDFFDNGENMTQSKHGYLMIKHKWFEKQLFA